MIEEKQRIIPMIYDVVFKSVLQDKESEDYLIDIISNITGIKKDYMKGNIVFKNSELPKNNIKEKGKATDLIVELKENIINLEMNKKLYKTVMISNVKINNEVVADHCWIRLNDNIFKGVIKGSLITIKATVKRYKKMINNEWKTDYCLQDVHSLNIIKEPEN